MFLKRILRWCICALLGSCGCYFGISCAATLLRAQTQPYLLSGGVRFDFMGYYIMAATNGAVCIAALLALFFFVRWSLRRTKKETEHKTQV